MSTGCQKEENQERKKKVFITRKGLQKQVCYFCKKSYATEIQQG